MNIFYKMQSTLVFEIILSNSLGNPPIFNGGGFNQSAQHQSKLL